MYIFQIPITGTSNCGLIKIKDTIVFLFDVDKAEDYKGHILVWYNDQSTQSRLKDLHLILLLLKDD